MWRLLLILSIIPLILGLVARWWFGLRILSAEGKRVCRCDINAWPAASFGEDTTPVERTAEEFADVLWKEALTAWKNARPKEAGSREKAKRFGMAVPPMSIIIAVFALIVVKIGFIAALAIVFAATALAVAFLILTLAAELQAVARVAKAVRQARAFRNRDDEDAVVNCSAALVWKNSLPPVLTILHR